MWVFLKDSFLSIVAPKASDLIGEPDLDLLLVRARVKGDIEKVFKGVVVHKSRAGKRDYAFRALIPRSWVASELASQVREITATNFKDSVEEPDRHNTYLEVWSVMNKFQTARGNPGMYGRLDAYEREAALHEDPAYEEYLRTGRRPRK